MHSNSQPRRSILSKMSVGIGFVFILLFSACSPPQPGDYDTTQTYTLNSNTYQVSLVHKGNYWLEGTQNGQALRPLEFPYLVWFFTLAELNGNAYPEVVAGVTKTAHYDPVIRKRLFIYEIKNQAFTPLWRGSRLPHPMEWFRVIRQPGKDLVRTIEYEENRLYLVAEYEYGSFGLDFREYLGRNLEENEALKLFYHEE